MFCYKCAFQSSARKLIYTSPQSPWIRNMTGAFRKVVAPQLYLSNEKFHHLCYGKKCTTIKETFSRNIINYSWKRSLHSSDTLCKESIIISTPSFPESVVEGDVRWDKSVGDEVGEDEVIGEIETDKTALPIVAHTAGEIEELFVEDGATVEKGGQLVKLKPLSGAASDKSSATVTKETTESSPKKEVDTEPPKAHTAESQSKESEEAGGNKKPLAVRSPTPTPPPPSSQLQSASGQQNLHDQKFTSEVKEVKESPTYLSGTRSETKVKMNRMRQRIAQRLKEAQNVNAMLTTFNEVDMSNIMAMRTKYKDNFFKKHNLKLGFMSSFIKASSVALEQMPTVNAVIEDNYVIYRDFVDISVAVATPKGLVVPVLRDVQKMNFADIEKGMSNLGEKARDGTLAIEDMDGGTFTISNGGVFGSLMGTPIINPPQSAILGMHGIFDRPVAINGKVEIRPMMYVALTYDHRLIDGREAVSFLRKIKQNVEDPAVMFLDM